MIQITDIVTCPLGSKSFREISNILESIGLLREESYFRESIRHANTFLGSTLDQATSMISVYIDSMHSVIVSFKNSCTSLVYNLDVHHTYEFLKHMEQLSQ